MSSKQSQIMVIDTETTGIHSEKDRIIELAALEDLGSDNKPHVWRINPGMPIPPSATAIHGITDQDVANCPSFPEVSGQIRAVIEKAQMLVGYNISFDINMIQAEFKRNREPLISLSDKTLIDPLLIWRQCEPRTLSDAVQRFVGEDFPEAHSASADVAATSRVLLGMLEHFGLQGMTWEQLEEFSNPQKKSWIGPSSHIQWQNGAPVIAFGKHKGTSLAALVEKHSDYLSWMISQDFPAHVKEILIAARTRDKKQLATCIETYSSCE